MPTVRHHHEKLFRDPVHDLIPFDISDPGERLLFHLIDTPEFQRLRRIRQLGMASIAYPGAEHTRYSHCLGCAHLARRMLFELAKSAELNAEDSLACVCAALLHDLGHGPFSHIMERVLNLPHEERTTEIILSDESGVHRVLSKHDPSLPERVAGLIKGEKNSIYSSIISSQLDADRLDYLLRDSMMTGVKYGVYDLERILKMMRVDESGTRIVMASKSLMAVEKYLQSRYHMYRQVYFHKTVTAAEAMLISLLRRAAALALRNELPNENPNFEMLKKLLLHARSITLSEFNDLDDATLLSWMKAWSHTDDFILSDLSTRLLERRLFKTVDLSFIGISLDEMLERGREIVVEAGLDPSHYFLRIQSSDTPYRPYDPQRPDTGGPILIEDPATNTIRDVEHLSPTISAFGHNAYTINRIAFPERHNGKPIRKMMESLFEKSGRSILH